MGTREDARPPVRGAMGRRTSRSSRPAPSDETAWTGRLIKPRFLPAPLVYHRGLMKSAAGDESGGQRSDPGPGDHTEAGKKDLPELDWNFDNVPDGELVACCYWEYARESAFIRETLRQYRDWCLAGGKRDDESRKID